ncbi:MAG: fibronectin type III domain-containing protein [Acidimicrobiales bacterium]|nr:fibronectin type III domain-containing protein [Acidimicrobiales bacterium]
MIGRRVACIASVSLALLASACTSGSDTTTPTTSSSTAPVESVEQPPVVTPAPNPPTGVFIVSTEGGQITLQWDPSRDDSVTGYQVVRARSGATSRVDVTTNEFVDSGLDDGDIYSYSVIAVGSGGESDRSDSVTAQVGSDTNPPSVPGRPRVIEDSTSAVALEWRASSDISGVASYEVSRRGEGAEETITVTEPTLVDDVEPGLVLTYSVVAVDTIGNRSIAGRSVTVLSGSSSDEVVIVVSGTSDPESDPDTDRLYRSLLGAGFSVSWFDDEAFDANLTRSDDVVLLLGDVQGEGFDWNVFSTDSPIIGFKSMFVQASGITENAPKLDRLAQLDYLPPNGTAREVLMTTTGRPKAVVYLPETEFFPDLEVWAKPVWSDTIAVAGLVPAGGELATEKIAPGCRAFFPGNTDSLREQTDEAWSLLIEFVSAVADRCTS